MPHRLLLLLLALFLPSLTSEARLYSKGSPHVEPGARVNIEVHSFYSENPFSGFAPLRITIDNRSGRERAWIARFVASSTWGDADQLVHEVNLVVPDGEIRRFDVLAPLPAAGDISQLRINFSGFGMSQGSSVHLNTHFNRNSARSFVAISPALANSNWHMVRRVNSSFELSGSSFDPALLPTDWRGFAGADQVWMTDEDWSQMGQTEQSALLEWVAFGHRLYICRPTAEGPPLPRLSGLTRDRPLAIGFGEVRDWPRQGFTLVPATTHAEMQRIVQFRHHVQTQSYHSGSWQPLADLRPIQMRSGLILGFLIVFAIIVGPINLYVFAGNTNRHRLFWTTPALSLGASALIFVLILLQDGVGGTGRQIALWHHFPAENKAALIQEQVSRTSLLTSRHFATENPVYLSQLSLGSMVSREPRMRTVGHRSFGGDWFQNRSIQGHLVEGMVATRWRVELNPSSTAEAPNITSTFSFPLQHLYYFDSQGRVWQGLNVHPGTPVRLQRVSIAEYQQTLASFTDMAGPIIKERGAGLRRLEPSQPRFVAIAENALESTESTLTAVRWSRLSLHTGPVVLP